MYQELLSLIKKGEFKHGDRLPPELDLCKILGVSRTALREGIRALAVINVLTITAGNGKAPGTCLQNILYPAIRTAREQKENFSR